MCLRVNDLIFAASVNGRIILAVVEMNWFVVDWCCVGRERFVMEVGAKTLLVPSVSSHAKKKSER